MNSEKKEIETIEISSSDLIRAPFDSTFTMEVAIPGLTHVDAKKVKPYVRAQGERHLLELESYQKRRSNYVIIVDTGNLCLRRGKEEKINLEINQLIRSFDETAPVSIMEFYRVEDQLVSDFIFSRKEARSLVERETYITCRASAQSANAISAIARTEPDWKELQKMNAGRDDWTRNVLIIFSSGNFKPDNRANQVVRTYDLDAYGVIYSPLVTAYAKRVFGGVVKIREGRLFWWKDKESLNFVDLFPVLWRFKLRTTLPYELEEKLHPLTVTITQGMKRFRILGELRYFQDPRALFFHRLRMILV